MANKKISELDAVTDLLSTDEYVLARSSTTKKITGNDLQAAIIAGGVGALSLLDEKVAPSGGSANFDFTSISGAYRHLELWGMVQSEGSATDLLMRFNNDSGANYHLQVDRGTGSSANAATVASQTSGNITSVPATGDGQPGRFKIHVPYYSEAFFKKMAFSEYGNWTSTSTITVGQFAVAWTGTAAISRVTLFLPSIDLKEGSTVSLYGIT